LVSGVQAPDRNAGKCLHYDDGEPETMSNCGAYGKPEQIVQDDPMDGIVNELEKSLAIFHTGHARCALCAQ